MLRFALVACLLAAACKGDPKGKTTTKGSAVEAPVVTTADPCAKAVAKGPITWIDDDYPAALACAKKKKQPLVLDLWAPWCHTCISMQTTVLMDPSFTLDNKKYVFAALDADREENADAVGKFSTSAMPTFYVIGDDEAVLARFVGAATLDQFHELLDSADRAKIGSIDEASSHFLAAQRAMAKKDYKTADTELTASLAAAPTAWLHRAEVIYMLQMAKQKQNDNAGCIAVSDAHLDEVGQTAIATNFWSTAIDCAKANLDDPKSKPMFTRAVDHLQKVLADKSAPLSVDDRSEAMGYLRDALDEIGKHGDAHKVAEDLAKLLDDAMAKAPTPFEKMQFLWPRAEDYVYLERPLDLVAEYEKLAADLPKEYEPRARLGWLYMKANKPAEAAKWTDEALALVYGPRKARLLQQRADIAKLTGDDAALWKYREDEVKLWESLPEGQRSPAALAKAKAILDTKTMNAIGSGAGSSALAGSAAAGSAK